MDESININIIECSFFLFVGCNISENKSDKEKYGLTIEKTQKLEKFFANNSELICSTTDNDEIKTFVENLNMDEWIFGDISSDNKNLEVNCKYVMYYDLDKKKYATLVTYKNSLYIDFSIYGLKMSSKITKEVKNYLNDFNINK